MRKMKKTLLFIMAAALCMCAVSCENINTSDPDELLNIKLNVGNPGVDTKAAKKGWEAGDKLNIWFENNGTDQPTPDLILSYDGTDWGISFQRSGMKATLQAIGTMTVVFEGYNDLTKYDIMWNGVMEVFGAPHAIHTDYTYCFPLLYFAEDVKYTYSGDAPVDGNTLEADILHWQTRTRLKVLVTGLPDTSPEYYELLVQNTTTGKYAEALSAWSIKPAEKQVAVHVAYNGGAQGKAGAIKESNGQYAFYYDEIEDGINNADVSFRLTNLDTGVSKTYSVTGKTLVFPPYYCTGVVLDYNKFN